MYHINDLMVNSRYKVRQAEISRAYDQQVLAGFSSERSPGLTSRTVDRLGNGLIRIGQKLKDGDGARPSTMHPTLDFD